MGRQAQFRPCIDLHDGRVKQIVGGTLEGADGGLKTNFVAEHDSAYFARMYSRDGLSGGHVIKLGSGNDEAARSALEAAPGTLQLGGGVTDENAETWLSYGADKVIVTSFVFADGELKRDRLSRLSRLVGREHLTLDLSCRMRNGAYLVVTDRWSRFSSLPVERSVLEDLAEFASEYLIHAVDVEGKRCGIDAKLLNLLAESAPIPCVYAGGVATFDDVSTIEREGGGRIDYTVGSALDIFGGSMSYAELVKRPHRENR
jgi:phosphoribosylformimino-5-aminoimidazole carboxamide ribotide isomerase